MKNIQTEQTKGFCLAKKEILRQREQITALMNEGIQLKGKWCRIFYRRSEKRKVAFIVAKRVGTAVRRNKVKRWLKELYRTQRELTGNPVEMAILVSQDSIELSFKNLKEDFLALVSIIRGKELN